MEFAILTFKCTAQQCWECSHWYKADLQNSLVLTVWNSTHIKHGSLFPSPSLVTAILLFVSKSLTTSDTSCKWNQTVFGSLWVTRSTRHNVLKVNLHRWNIFDNIYFSKFNLPDLSGFETDSIFVFRQTFTEQWQYVACMGGLLSCWAAGKPDSSVSQSPVNVAGRRPHLGLPSLLQQALKSMPGKTQLHVPFKFCLPSRAFYYSVFSQEMIQVHKLRGLSATNSKRRIYVWPWIK